MTAAQCRRCHRAAEAGAYCSSCAADIMADAINPYFRVQRKKLPPERGTLLPRTRPTSFNPSTQHRLFE